MLLRLERREAMLRVASFVATQFLRGSWQNSIQAILEMLGTGTDVSRVYVFENHPCPHDESLLLSSQRFEWAAPGITAQISETKTQNMNWGEAGLDHWAAKLRRGEILQGTTAQFPAREQGILLLQDIQAIALVPIHIEGQWWGLLGFDECRQERVWDEAEIEVLHLVADMMSAAISRERTDAALRASESEFRTLFEAMDDAVFIIDRAGHYCKAAATNPNVLAKPLDELRRGTLTSVLGDKMGPECGRIVHDVLDTRSMRRFEYPLEIDGRSLWFSASVTPLTENTVLWVTHDMTQAHQARESLRQSEELFRLLAENSTDKIARVRPDGTLLYVSPSVETILGYTVPQFMQTKVSSLLHPEDRETVITWHKRVLEGEKRHENLIYRIRHQNGHYLWFETTSRAVRGNNGKVSEIHTVSRDITQRRNAENALKAAEAKYRSIFENAVEGIFQTTPNGTYIDANPSLARIYGYDSPAQLIASMTDIGQQLYVESGRRADFIKEMNSAGSVANFESQIRRKDGKIIWISENARSVQGEDGELTYFEGTVEDITARKSAEEQLLHDALHDKLTGLANRALFMDRMGQAFGRLKRHHEALFAVLFLDFDRFKNVNDSLGHLAGDQLLIQLATRLQGCLRPGDTVSRLGGDEFAILLEEIADVEEAIVVAERIQKEMTTPFQLVGQEVFSSASIGIALAGPQYEKTEDLLRDADVAMYRAKAMGKARHEVFNAGMHQRAVALLQLETDLRWASERQEFRLWYQPIITLETGQIGGFEALIRWQHPERGLVSPLDFIPVAEETGWIVPIGRWVLEEACQQLAQWHRDFPREVPLTMSVNLSSKQFMQSDLIPFIESLIRLHNLPPGTLKLEITESALMENAQDVTDRLLQMRAVGCLLGLDDFGTGYSSLSYLHRFPLDTLKIDRSFIARMTEGGENREIVRTIVSLGRNLGLDVVAEGVEDEKQLADLRVLNCKSGQGYFFARPLPAPDAHKLIAAAPIW
jgi:diguanylate cyclase (GGDEF)-like protein/PAS domain S-box-containing protein